MSHIEYKLFREWVTDKKGQGMSGIGDRYLSFLREMDSLLKGQGKETSVLQLVGAQSFAELCSFKLSQSFQEYNSQAGHLWEATIKLCFEYSGLLYSQYERVEIREKRCKQREKKLEKIDACVDKILELTISGADNNLVYSVAELYESVARYARKVTPIFARLLDDDHSDDIFKLYNLQRRIDAILILAGDREFEAFCRRPTQAVLDYAESLHACAKEILAVCNLLITEKLSEDSDFNTVLSTALENLQEKLGYVSESDIIEHRHFVVKAYAFECAKNHYIETIRAQIELIGSEGELITAVVPAGYCEECDCYFVLRSDFEALLQKGIPLCRQITQEEFLERGFRFNGDELNAQSWLNQLGYQLRGTTVAQRRFLLKNLVDLGFSSVEICGMLDWYIRKHQYNPRTSHCCPLWQEDRDYISRYASARGRQVKISSIFFKIPR